MSSNAQSTAWAIQGLEAAGVSPATLHRGGAISPLAYLDSLVGANGAVRYSRGVSQTPVWVTGEALMAMEGKPLPIAAPAPPPSASNPAARSHSTTSAARHHTPASATHAAWAKRAPAHTAGRRHGTRSAPTRVPTSIFRNQVLAGAFAHAMGVVTALALAPVGLG
jgi:hypothetical protein